MNRRLIVSGGSRQWEIVLIGPIVVGRDPACEVSELSDPLLSRRHAEFTSTATGVTVRDLGSRNGILVNGAKTPQAVLSAGDVVQIGHLQVKLVEQPGPFLDLPAAAAPADAVTRALVPNFDSADDPTYRIDARTVVGNASDLTIPRSFGDDDETGVPTKKAPS